MITSVAVVGETPVQLWHLSNRERLQRQIAQQPTLQLAVQLADVQSDRLLSVWAGYLFDGTTLSQLAEQDHALLLQPENGRVAAVVSNRLSAVEQQELLNQPADQLDDNHALAQLTPQDLAVYDDKLRRHTAPTLELLDAAKRPLLEAQLYGAAYKGITDLVTKWWWPRPAKHGVRVCAALGITPNQVTLFGAALMLLAMWLFYEGYFVSGLLAGWIMTWLDTVDGKLARVTVQSSKIGHVLDHGMDIVHPPFWYLVWGLGLNPNAPVFEYVSLAELNMLIFGGYIAGRLIEGAFHALGTCGLFSWRPFDAYFRLITGRRNPCLILLTIGVVIGRPDLGLLWVAYWTALSSLILFARLLYAAWVRWRSGPLHSWLQNGQAAALQHPHAYRTFASTRVAYETSDNHG